MQIEIYARVRPRDLAANTKLSTDIFNAVGPLLPKNGGIGISVHNFFLGDDVRVQISRDVGPPALTEEKKQAFVAAIEPIIKRHLKRHECGKIVFEETLRTEVKISK